MKTSSTLCVIVIVLCYLGARSLADVPHFINFQGTLADSSGNPITDTTQMDFTIYADSLGGTALWSETHSSVDINNGGFHVMLGSISSLSASLFEHDELWLETNVGTEILSPRQKLVSVPFGFRSEDADHAILADSALHAVHADTAQWAIGIGDITYADTADYAYEAGAAFAANEANHAIHADTAIFSLESATAISATSSTYADTSNYAILAGSAGNATYADSSVSADEAIHAVLADTADYASQSTYSDTADYTYVAATSTNSDEATHAMYSDTASWALDFETITHVDTADYALQAEIANNATTADHAATSDTANWAWHTPEITRVDTADFALFAESAINANSAATASHADTADYALASEGNTLDQAYDQGGPGVGRTIAADAGTVTINGPDGLAVTGDVTIGALTRGSNIQMITDATSAEVKLEAVSTLEEIALKMASVEGASLTMIGGSGDEVTKYDPSRMFFVQLQPEPPSPDSTMLGPEGLTFKRTGQSSASYNLNELTMTADAGNEVTKYDPSGMFFVQLQPEPPGPDTVSLGLNGLVFTAIATPSNEVTSYGAGGILFNTIGPPMMPDTVALSPNGLVFTEVATPNNEVSSYGPGKLLFNTIGPPEMPDTVSLGPAGLVFTEVATPSNEVSSYGPGKLLFNTIGPPAMPDTVSLSPGGLIFKEISTRTDVTTKYNSEGMFLSHAGSDSVRLSLGGLRLELGTDVAEYDNEGVLLTHATGGDSMRITAEGLRSNLATDLATLDGNGIIFTHAGGDSTRITAEGLRSNLSTDLTSLNGSGIILTHATGVDSVQLSLGGLRLELGANIAEYDDEGVLLTHATGVDSVRITSGGLSLNIGGDLFTYGGRGTIFTHAGSCTTQLDTSGLILDFIAGTTEYTNNGIYMKNATGDTTVSVSNQGTIYVKNDAGSTGAVRVGDRYRDNSVVAWARVTSSGSLNQEFGVTSVSNISTGYYSITIDADISSGLSLIPMVTPEIDSQPTTASDVRLVSVNQTSTANIFEVFINNGNYTPVNNDFVFMVTGR